MVEKLRQNISKIATMKKIFNQKMFLTQFSIFFVSIIFLVKLIASPERPIKFEIRITTENSLICARA